MFVCLFVPFAPSFLRILKLKIVVVANHDIHLAGNHLVPNPAAYNTEMMRERRCHMHECRGSKRQAYFRIRILLRGFPVAAAFLPFVPLCAGRPCICRSHALEKSQYYVPGEMGSLLKMNTSARIHSSLASRDTAAIPRCPFNVMSCGEAPWVLHNRFSTRFAM